MIACRRGVRHSWEKTMITTAGPLRVRVCSRCKVAVVLEAYFESTDALALAMADAVIVHRRSV